MYIAPPRNSEPLTLFEYSVQRVISLGLMNEKNTHQVWANHIFKYENKAFVRSELMSIVKREYPQYFDENLQYMFLEEKIKASFPHLFGIKEKHDLIERILQALDAECTYQRLPRNQKTYRVISCDHISVQDNKNIYKAQLKVEEGDDPHFDEGISFEFRTDIAKFTCEVIEFDYANAILFFNSPNNIYITLNSRVVSDATMNTIALIKLLKEISILNIDKKIPLYKFINGSTRNLSNIKHSDYPSYLDKYISEDKSQFKAFKAALDKDITFIWGPPGTGKSYTLSAIIMALHKMKDERTAVCCLSNVAVDQLVSKVVEIIETEEPNMPKGEFY